MLLTARAGKHFGGIVVPPIAPITPIEEASYTLPYDGGFTVYVDAEGNIVCGWPPVANPREPIEPLPEGPWTGPEPLPEDRWSGPYPAPLYEGPVHPYGDDGIVFFEVNPKEPKFYEQPGMPYPGTVDDVAETTEAGGKPYDDGTSKLPPIVYGPGGVAPEEPGDGTEVTLYDDGGFVVYIDADGNVVCGYPPGPIVPPTEFPAEPVGMNVPEGFTVYVGPDGTVICGNPIDVPNPVQAAIDAFVLNGAEQAPVLASNPEPVLSPAVFTTDIRYSTDLPPAETM